MQDIAWVAIVDSTGFSIGLAEKDTAGYSPLKVCCKITFTTYHLASEEAERRNARLGLTPDESLQIVLSSMRGK